MHSDARSILTPAIPELQGLAFLILEAESRGALVFTTRTATRETDVTELFFFLSGSRYPCVCQSTNRMHTHFRPTETGPVTFFLPFFFF